MPPSVRARGGTAVLRSRTDDSGEVNAMMVAADRPRTPARAPRGVLARAPTGALAVLTMCLILLAVGCAAKPASSSGPEIVIGASIPLSGPLAGFGSFQRWGYQHAVEEVNRAGGLKLGGDQ